METKTRTAEFPLGGEGIDLMSDWLEEAQSELGVEHRNRIRVRLLVEEVLIRLRDHLGGHSVAQATCDARFGRPRLRIKVAGEPFNPLAYVEPELGAWDSSLRGAIGLVPQYAYEGGCNVLRLPLPHHDTSPVVRIAVAILIGIVSGAAGTTILPATTRTAIVDALLTPTYDMWCRLLTAISGPIIFCTVATAMLNARRIDDRGGSNMVVIVRYFALSLVVVAVALLCAAPLYSLDHMDVQVNAGLVANLLDGLLNVVPANVIVPFATSNTSQLLFLAFVFGYVLTRLEGQVSGLTKLVREANMVGLRLAGWAGRLVPILTGVFLCLEMWQERVSVLMGLWRPLLISLIISWATLALLALLTAHNVSVAPTLLAQKLRPPFVIAMRTGSLDESFGEATRSSSRLLGIDAGYVRDGLPQGLVLYMPTSAIGTIVFTLFVSRELGVQGSALWYASAVVMSVVVFVATPPVPGANLLAYVALFTALGIPEEALLDAMVFDIVFGIFAGAANQATLQLELLHQASHLKLVDIDTLRVPVADAS